MLIILLALLGGPLLTYAEDAAEPPRMVPDEQDTRRHINDLIASFVARHKPATLGLFQQSIDLSISFGAPAYNVGDHAACYHFYSKTAESLIAAFAGPKATTEAAGAALGDLQNAVARAKAAPDADKAAWMMRYAFDKTALAYTLKQSGAQQLVSIGMDCFKRAQYADAQDAFSTASADLKELDGQATALIPIDARFAPLALANALFAQRKYADAVGAIQNGLTIVPEWPSAEHDLRADFGDPADYEALLDDLTDKAGADPQNAGLQFLLGYHEYFTGKRELARAHFERASKLDPALNGPKIFLEHFKATPETPAPQGDHDVPGQRV
jgi:tetratricopeptide (TPR) repeat protein